MPPSVAASLEDILSVGGSHSDAEAVRLVALAGVRLESSLHGLGPNGL